jgi:hypothetical protein
MTTFVKSGGIWKTANSIFVKDGGLWKTVQGGFVKDAGVWKKFYAAPVSLTFTVEVWGQGGQVAFSNIVGYPRSGFGGYNKVTVTAMSNQVGVFSADGSEASGTDNGAALFSIDGQWIVSAGAGGRVGSYVTWTSPGFQDASAITANNGLDGSGGYNSTGLPARGIGGGFQTSIVPSGTCYWWESGKGGGGAPPGTGSTVATSLQPGPGGQGNIRCYYDNGTTSGSAGGVATMSFVTSSTGVYTGIPKMTITNSLGRSQTYTVTNGNTTTIPLSNILNY